MKQKSKKVFKVLKKIFDIVSDVLIYPLIIIAIVIGFSAIASKNENRVNSIFGYSVVTILSGSMVAGGFNIGDIVFLQPFEAWELRVGDIISFYSFKDPQDPNRLSMQEITNFEEPPTPTSQDSVIGNKTIEDAISEERLILFHRITKVYMASDGTLFFETKGDSNRDEDSILIRQDFIIGKYLPTPKFISTVSTFVSSPKGITYVVIIPLGILIFFQIIEVTTIAFAIATEKKVLSGNLAFDSEESTKAKIGEFMRDYDKVYFYDITAQKDKEKVKDFLWGYLTKKKVNENLAEYEKVNTSLKFYENSREDYWNFWLKNEKNKSSIKKLLKLKRVADILKMSSELNGNYKLNKKVELPKKAERDNTFDSKNK